MKVHSGNRYVLMICLVLAGFVCFPGASQAIEDPCDGVTGFPCGFSIEEVSLQKAPPLFQFQTRISQVKLPQGDAIFQKVAVKLLRDGQALCTELFENVQVRGNTLNLLIGQHMDCDLDEVVAESANLSFQVCIGGTANCLKPVELSTAPFAIKTSYAFRAQQAARARTAAQATYAHRATADRDFFVRDKLGAGYFDFYTHVAADAVSIYPDGGYDVFKDGGFIQWTATRDPAHPVLHLAAKSVDTGQVSALEKLVLIGNETIFRGDLVVDPGVGSEGLTINGDMLNVKGDSDFDTLSVGGAVTAEGGLLVSADMTLQDTLVITEGLTVSGGGIVVAGLADISENLTVDTGLVKVSPELTIPGDTGTATFSGETTITQMKVTGTMTVDGNSTLTSLSAESGVFDLAPSAGTLNITTGASFDGNVTVGNGMEVTDPVTFSSAVTIDGAILDAGGADMRYLRYEDEDRALSFGGRLTFEQGVSISGNLEQQGNQVVNARLHSSKEPPAPCTLETEGLVYHDTDEKTAKLCHAGYYRNLGGDAECGNNNVEPKEECDDGNTLPGDGCTDICVLELGWDCTPKTTQPTVCASVCGDGYIRGEEECDDQNGMAGDGCDDQCKLVPPWTCVGEPSVCAVCGDGLIEGAETCDDGNTDSGDGCDGVCTMEPGWACDGVPSACYPEGCGDGSVEGEEECDDGNNNHFDGCSSACKIEDGWSCAGQPSQCDECGNDVIGGPETCDDGNASADDGCSDSCQIEAGWVCNGFPSICSPENCGDGAMDVGEECDDGDLEDEDGCSHLCSVEDGWLCGGEPSTCSVCGDGLTEGIEVCDDGNNDDGDGCDALCAVEGGWACEGDPSLCYPESCGDGIFEAEEECDDGNHDDGDGCSLVCTVEDGWECDTLVEPSVCEESDKCDPVSAGSIDTDGIAFDVAVSGDIALVADWENGLQLFDVSDPATPVAAGSFSGENGIRGVAASGSIAYVADHDYAVRVVDFSNPANPIAIGMALSAAGNKPQRSQLQGNLLYVANYSNGIAIFDVSDPSSPVELGNLGGLGSVNAVAASGNYMFTAANAGEFSVVDISNKAAPTKKWTNMEPGQCMDIKVVGDMVYLAKDAGLNGGLVIYDVSDPLNPVQLSAFAEEGVTQCWAVEVVGSKAILGCTSVGLVVFDVTDPAAPVFQGSLSVPGFAYGLDVKSTFAYVSAHTAGGLQIVDVSDCDIDASVCGDGSKAADEGCDDGNGDNGDGCSASCQLELGWTCSGNPSACKRACTWTYNGHCYMNFGSQTDLGSDTTWANARETCQAPEVGGYLIKITDALENAEVATNGPDGQWDTLWLGLSDAAEEGTWKWVSEAPGDELASYSNWAVGEPIVDDYVELRKTDGKWKAVGGNHILPFVCERDTID